MTIHKATSSSYSTVNPRNVVRYINEYTEAINKHLSKTEGKKLEDCNKTQLNAIAAELETVKKRLDYILYGRY